MAEIRILPKSTAELIAAGEVVERPSSVVKELAENSIDAGARQLCIEIKNGGKTYIRVSDDGCGISRSDIEKAFLSHATSKISSAEDLFGIETLGFRGEALPSIAAVSELSVLTRTEAEEEGTFYELRGTESEGPRDAGCPVGTTIIVRNLFYNTPARMKFMKKDVTEGNSVAGIVDRIALSHPEISVRFIRDGKQQLVTSGNSKLSSAVYSVFGSEFLQGLTEVCGEKDGIRISGLCSLPGASRGNRSMQLFFLNGRLIKSLTAQAALEQAYKNSIMTGRFPACVLNISLPPSCVDVNVHPAKTEVRFENEKHVFDAIYYSVKSAISEKDRPSRLDLARLALKQQRALEKEIQPYSSASSQLKLGRPSAKTAEHSYLRDEGDGEAEGGGSAKGFREARAESRAEGLSEGLAEARAEDLSEGLAEAFSERKEPESFEDGSNAEKAESKNGKSKNGEGAAECEGTKGIKEKEAETMLREAAGEEPPSFRILGEAFRTYIFAELEEKIIIIDKHAAHERLLFEKLVAEKGKTSSQLLLKPLTLTLSKEEYSALLSASELLKSAGYVIEDFGPGCVAVRECPSMLEYEDIKTAVEEIAAHLLEGREPLPEKVAWIYHNTACRAAVKAGSSLSETELYGFTAQLLANPKIRYCPHGRPVLIEITRSELERQFGRSK